jgi:hypothetical protein
MRTAHGADVPQVAQSQRCLRIPIAHGRLAAPARGASDEAPWLATLDELVAFCDRHAVAGVARFRALAPAGRARSSAGRNVSRRSKPHRQCRCRLCRTRGVPRVAAEWVEVAHARTKVSESGRQGECHFASASLLFEGAACRKQSPPRLADGSAGSSSR